MSVPSGPVPGGTQGGAAGQGQRRGGWQGFAVPNRNGQPDGGARSFPSPGATQSYPSRPAATYEPVRGGGRGTEAGPRNDARPALDLRQPILRERGGSSGGDGRQGGGNRGSAPGGRGSESGRSNFTGHSSRGR